MKTIAILVLPFVVTISAYGQTSEMNFLDQSSPPTENGEIWYDVDVLPSFPGGMAKFFDYINKNLKYPKDAKKERIEGRVMIEFVVDSTGGIRPGTIKILDGLLKSCDDEAIRLISESPLWIPGRVTELNKNVPVRMVIPIRFKR